MGSRNEIYDEFHKIEGWDEYLHAVAIVYSVMDEDEDWKDEHDKLVASIIEYERNLLTEEEETA